MALALLWITQLQAAPSLLDEAELQVARDPVGYLQRLDASPRQDMELFYARALAQAALGRYPQALLDNARARGLASARQASLRLLDFRLQQIALTLEAETPERALDLLTQLWPAVRDHPAQASEWHALNGLAFYRAQQMKEAILELKTALQQKQQEPVTLLSTLQCGRLLMTLGNLYADLSLHREAERYYQDALEQMTGLNDPNSQAIIRANMARLYIDMAHPARANQLLDALLATPGLSPRYRAIVLGYQAMVFNAQGEWRAAWLSLEEAQAIYDGLGTPQAASRLAEIRAKTLMGRGEKLLALQLLMAQSGPLSMNGRAMQARLLADLGRYPEAYGAMARYMQSYKQHFNQTLSQHAAAFQVERDLARSEASNRALQLENENKRRQLLYQQSARNYQLLLLVLLAGALILLGLTTRRLHRNSRHLYTLATFDQLTGLPNRRALLERLAQQWQQGGPLTLIIIDIDHFKQINDRHGHQAGDEAIRQLARELKSWAPDQQQLGRLGGEEFLVAMTLDGASCWQLAEQLRHRVAYLAAPHMTVSIGVAERSPEDEHLDQLIHRADMAMYQAKRQGRNQTVLAQPPGDGDELACNVA
ncbi:GGDEF domain-containing protein [Aeromonas taiwanensis]|uniref:diguanylate cyclase n=1 Tax=Aeromonas taiwanensis TaxID=633417 RepID=A0A5F0K8A8_9GAMM|nr:GGDEF domain-containing protein [Aeromonas taiwanensis]TFF74197.1 GGDEF domain-containing protein [Aeromonas taiwanensis]TFF77356.1 GGDEF domain-containing protein [Aeromonas taiwanensis]